MGKYTFLNIGKANAEIDRLTAELAAAKSATAPDDGKLAEALASNDEISKELENVNAELAEAKKKLSAITYSFQTTDEEFKQVLAGLNKAAQSIKINPLPTTAVGLVSALETSVSDTLAKLQVPASAIPAAAPAGAAGAQAAKETKGRDKAVASFKIQGVDFK